MCSQKTIEGINSGKLIAVPKWTSIFNYISLPVAVIAIFYVGYYASDFDNRTFTSSKERDNFIHSINDNTSHRLDYQIHMSYQRKTELFVPRTEVEILLKNINDGQDKIMKKLNIIN